MDTALTRGAEWKQSSEVYTCVNNASLKKPQPRLEESAVVRPQSNPQNHRPKAPEANCDNGAGPRRGMTPDTHIGGWGWGAAEARVARTQVGVHGKVFAPPPARVCSGGWTGDDRVPQSKGGFGCRHLVLTHLPRVGWIGNQEPVRLQAVESAGGEACAFTLTPRIGARPGNWLGLCSVLSEGRARVRGRLKGGQRPGIPATPPRPFPSS